MPGTMITTMHCLRALSKRCGSSVHLKLSMEYALYCMPPASRHTPNSDCSGEPLGNYADHSDLENQNCGNNPWPCCTPLWKISNTELTAESPSNYESAILIGNAVHLPSLRGPSLSSQHAGQEKSGHSQNLSFVSSRLAPENHLPPVPYPASGLHGNQDTFEMESIPISVEQPQAYTVGAPRLQWVSGPEHYHGYVQNFPEIYEDARSHLSNFTLLPDDSHNQQPGGDSNGESLLYEEPYDDPIGVQVNLDEYVLYSY